MVVEVLEYRTLGSQGARISDNWIVTVGVIGCQIKLTRKSIGELGGQDYYVVGVGGRWTNLRGYRGIA